MTFFLQLLVSGFLYGALYALIALGFVLIYKSSGVFNFAQGELLMLSAYVCWSCVGIFPLWLAFVITFVFAIALGLLIEHICIRPLVGQPLLAIIMVTIGLSCFLRGVVYPAWGGCAKPFPKLFPFMPWKLGEIAISQQYVYIFLISALVVGILLYFFARTTHGLAMRAMAEDHQAAQSVGIDVKGVFGQAWVIACLVSAVGAILVSSINGIKPEIYELGLKVLPVVILGRLGSVGGAIIAGLTIGILENLVGGYIDPAVGGGLAAVSPYIVLMIVLMVKPYGLFGLQRIERI